ncbi:MAG: choice-of-anchor Q domain-containing protein [Planctomycetota bacterium]
MTLTNSTVSDNSAEIGGGFYNGEGALTLTNSTVSGNSATHFSGIGGGGIYNLDGVLTLTNSIVGNSSSGGDCYNDGGVLNDNGFNIVEDGSCGFPAAGDPTLGPLTDNGGPTQTHAMLPGSIAINAIDNPAACTVTMKLPLNVGRTASREQMPPPAYRCPDSQGLTLTTRAVAGHHRPG